MLAFFTPCTHPCDFMASPRTTVIKIWAKAIREKGLGNCFEFTILAEDLLQARHPNIVSTFCYLPDCDHVFLKLSEGANAVYGDFWGGKIYTEAEFLDKVKGYRCINYQDTYYNAIINFNPNVHSVDARLLNTGKACLSIFLGIFTCLLILGLTNGLLSRYLNNNGDDDMDYQPARP